MLVNNRLSAACCRTQTLASMMAKSQHVGSLFDYVDRHYNHGHDTYPLAHNPVTSYYVSGPVRFPVDLRLYRRYEELTQWEAFVHKHFPDRPIPRQKKERAQLHKAIDPVLLQDPAFEKLHQQFRTKIDLGLALRKRNKLMCWPLILHRCCQGREEGILPFTPPFVTRYHGSNL